MIKNINSSSFENKIKNTLEDNDECWFSSHKEEQEILIELEGEAFIHKIVIQYQKGFECVKGELCIIRGDTEFKKQLDIENEVGDFCDKIKIKLNKSRDLYNRFCIYRIKIE